MPIAALIAGGMGTGGVPALTEAQKLALIIAARHRPLAYWTQELWVNWNGDGTTLTDESVWLPGLSGITLNESLDKRTGQPEGGVLTIEMVDPDRRYDRDNPASPIYSYLTHGGQKALWKFGWGGQVIGAFGGRLVRPVANRDASSATIVVQDVAAWTWGELNYGPYEDQTTDVTAKALMEQCGLVDGTDFACDTGETTSKVAAVVKGRLWDELTKLAIAEGGGVRIDHSVIGGKVLFVNRTNWQNWLRTPIDTLSWSQEVYPGCEVSRPDMPNHLDFQYDNRVAAIAESVVYTQPDQPQVPAAYTFQVQDPGSGGGTTGDVMVASYSTCKTGTVLAAGTSTTVQMIQLAGAVVGTYTFTYRIPSPGTAGITLTKSGGGASQELVIFGLGAGSTKVLNFTTHGIAVTIATTGACAAATLGALLDGLTIILIVLTTPGVPTYHTVYVAGKRTIVIRETDLTVDWRYPVPCVFTTVASCVANTKADGTGTNIPVTAGDAGEISGYSDSLHYIFTPSEGFATIQFQNLKAANVYVTALTINGRPADRSVPWSVPIEDHEAQMEPGAAAQPVTVSLSNPYLSSAETADARGHDVLAFLQGLREQYNPEIDAAPWLHAGYPLTLTDDRIAGTSTDLHLRVIAHQLTLSGGRFESKLRCAKGLPAGDVLCDPINLPPLAVGDAFPEEDEGPWYWDGDDGVHHGARWSTVAVWG